MIKKRSLLACVVLICMTLCMMPAGTICAESVSCGDNVTYILEDGVLTVSGIGDMDDFVSPNNVPWHEQRELIKNVIIDEGITSVGSYAFCNCTELETVTLPESLKVIGRDSFLGCEAIQGVYLTDLTAWCAVSFYDVSSNPLYYTEALYLNEDIVEDLYIPDVVKSVGELAFYNLDCITSVTFADSVTQIGDFSFYGCDNLSYINFGNSVEQIGAFAFSACDSVKEISIPDTVTEIGQSAFYHCSLLKSVMVGNGVQSIGSAAFERCASLSDVTLGENVQTIGTFAFCNCDALQNIIIPENVVEIGSSAFRFCDAIERIDIPASVTEIGNEAFAACEGLLAIEVHSENTVYSSENGVLFNKDKTKLIKCPPSKAGECFEIPETVIAIDISAFSGCEALKTIVIPESVTQICSFAFEFCTSLTDVTLGKNVKSIGPFVFMGCNGLTDIAVDEDNFYYCSVQGVLFNKKKSELLKYPAAKSDAEFELPATLTEVAEDAFSGCDALDVLYCKATAEEWEQIATKSKLSDRVQIVYVPHFALETVKDRDDLLITAHPKNLSTEADTFVATFDAGGKVLEIKRVTAGKQTALSAENAVQVKAFAFGEQFVPVIENIVEILQ